MVDSKIKFSVKDPAAGRQRVAERRREMVEKAQRAFFTDFTSITFGDYINAFSSFSMEPSTASMDGKQRTAYYTFFAYEESIKRLNETSLYIN